MSTLKVSCRVIFSSTLHAHISTFSPTGGTVVLVDVKELSEFNFWDSLESQVGLALYRLTVMHGIKWHVFSRKGVGHVNFPTENFRDPDLPFPKDGFGGPYLNPAKNLDKIHSSLKEFTEDLIDLSRFDNHEYQVEKLGVLMSMALKWNSSEVIVG